MSDAGDEALWEGICRGDEQAFAAVYDRFGPSLLRVARALVGSREQAEDCVQDVFVGLVTRARKSAGIVNLRAYLFAALRHRAARRDVHAQARLSLDEAAEPADSWKPESGGDRTEHLQRALARLPAEQRQVVILKTHGGLSFAEMAAVLQVSANTVASRYRYALEKLRAALAEEPHV